jgi:hypothetical protein
MKTQYHSRILVIIGLLVTVTSGRTAVPVTINYQGRMTQADGTPLAGEPITLRISVHDANVEGRRVWGPQSFTNVPVTAGCFNVIIGSKDDSGASLTDAFGAGERYLEVAVGTNPPIVPRQAIPSTPFALYSGNDVPIGGIVSWIPPVPLDGLTMDVARQLLPPGFVICDGAKSADDPKTAYDERRIPQLTDARFLRGAMLDALGNQGGGEPHVHRLFSLGQSGTTVPNTDDWGGGTAGQPQDEIIARRGHTHSYDGSALSTTVVPRHCNVLFIIRVN